MVSLPAILGGVYVVEQVAVAEFVFASVHVGLLKLPSAPPSLSVTVPVGVTGVALVSVTVMV
jgi:hypothetical protein